MTDLADALRPLLDYPTSAPEPVEALHGRVALRRRRRARRRAAVAGLAAVAVAMAVAPLASRSAGRPTRIATAPVPSIDATATTPPAQLAGAVRLEYSLPDGWDTVYNEGNRLAVSTRPLSDRDSQLAILTRADAAFSAFPPDAVVVAVGADPLDVKYGTNWDGTTTSAGPAYALGSEQVLAGGVRFRKGDVPQSILQIASYAGPDAPASRLLEAEAVAASIRLVSDPNSSPSPSPSPAGAVAAPALAEVARAGAGRTSIVLEAGSDCAYFRPADSQPQVTGHDRLGGGCGARPTGSGIAPMGPAVLVWGDPGTAPATASALRVGPDVRAVSARTADGRTFPAVLGADGWGVAVGPGRIVALIGVDSSGRQVEAFVR